MVRSLVCAAALALGCAIPNPAFSLSSGTTEGGEASSSSGPATVTGTVGSASATGGEATGTGALSATGEVTGEVTGAVTGAGTSTSTSAGAGTSTGEGTSTGGGADTGSSGEGTTGVKVCAGVCGSPGCGTCPDGPMVDFPGFSIDAHEVSSARYGDFLAVDVDPGAQPAVCAWNLEFTPSKMWPPDDPQLPVVFVDWCDARAYCHWAGKRLCGAIGGGSGDFDKPIDPKTDQWYRACAGDPPKFYPYGVLYSPKSCNGKDFDLNSDARRPSGSIDACQGATPGLFDMSGNVFEWVDACDGESGAGDACLRRGGSSFSILTDLRCDLKSSRRRDLPESYVGIRCCSL